MKNEVNKSKEEEEETTQERNREKEMRNTVYARENLYFKSKFSFIFLLPLRKFTR